MCSGHKPLRRRLSVRELVAFSAQSGDLYHQSGQGGPDALEGQLGHQQVQKQRDKQWQSEVALKHSFWFEQDQITLRGRLDLLCAQAPVPIVEEIKTAYTPLDLQPESKQQLHWAQAKVYACLYHHQRQQESSGIGDESQYRVRISVYHLHKKRLYSEEATYEAAELEQFTRQLIERFLCWYRPFRQHRQQLILSAQAMDFPFAQYRPGQHAFARTVYRAIRDRQRLLIQAPTGTGKTLSTVFPALKALGSEQIEQCFYLTAKGSAQGTALDTLWRLVDAGLHIDYLVLQAKDKTCPCRSEDEATRACCQSEDGRCAYTVGFFDRLPEARLACLSARHLNPETLLRIAHTHQLCPFELGLQMVSWAALVVGDVNYALDPMVRLNALDRRRDKRVFLIDEIHNLNDRAREMYSAELDSADARRISRQLGQAPRVKRHAQALARHLEQLYPASQTLDSLPTELLPCLRRILEAVEHSDDHPLQSPSAPLSQIEGFGDWLKQLYRFLTIVELYGEAHVCTYTRQEQRKRPIAKLRLLCLDAAAYLHQQYQSARALVGFSATLQPMHFYQRVLGYREEDAGYSLPAVFPVEHQLTLHCRYIDTRWQAREASLPALCTLIQRVSLAKPGKYLVFFPSYTYMQAAHQQYAARFPLHNTVMQQPQSDAADRETFLAAFFSQREAMIGFAIMGGVFGEGVDYVGDALDGTLVVGTGMPQPSHEQQLLADYFQQQQLNRYQYAYQFPGFVRVQQAAGRVIRSESDRGVVVLVDPRFAREDFRTLMPEHWQVRPCHNLDACEAALSAFWHSA